MMFKSTYHCRNCGNKWAVKTRKPPSYDDPCPPCPNLACGEIQTPIGIDLNSNKAPAQVGQNNSVKAIDETQKIVTQDYGMSDIRSDVRMHETATPKLPPHQQARADNFFGGSRPAPNVRALNPLQNAAQMAAATALQGAARQNLYGASDPISDLHAAKHRVPIHNIVRSR